MIARVLLGAGALQAVLFLYYLLRGTYALPAFDLLDILEALLRGVGWAWFFQPHNEHLLLLPKLWFAFDLAVLRGSLIAHSLLCGAIWAGAFAALLPLIRRAAGPDPGLALAASGLLAVLWFRAFTLEPFVIALGFGFLGMLGAAVGAIVLAGRIGVPRRGDEGRGKLFGCVLLGLAALASLANGILALPVAALAALRRDRWLPAAVLLAVGVVAAAGYAALRPGGPAGIDPPTMARFLVVFFGAPWIKLAPEPAKVVSALTILALLAIAPLALFGRDLPGRIAGALALFTLGTAVLVAYGRHRFGLDQATAGRYGLFVVTGHAAILIAGTGLLRTAGGPMRAIVAVVAVSAALMLLGEQWVIGQRYVARADAVAALRASLAQTAPAVEPFAMIHPVPAHAVDVLKRLQAEGFYGLR